MARAWETIEAAETPDGRLELRRRGPDDFLITVGGRVLMNSRAERSEHALGALTAAAIGDRPAPRVLAGGLGMGLTLRALLDGLPADARVRVSELNPAVRDWCLGPLAELTDGAARDPRVEVVIEDVAAPIRHAAARYDAIALDLYEGPHPERESGDHPHYGRRALGAAFAALSPGGVLAIWSEDTGRGFERALERTGFAVESRRFGRGGRRHGIYLATRS